MDRWLGDGGMALLRELGASLDAYGVDGEDLGWAEGDLAPTSLALNPAGGVQAGVHVTVLDAAMNFAINAALASGERAEATLEISTELVRGARSGVRYRFRGEVVRLSRRVAFAEGTIRDPDGQVVSRASATFLVRRADAPGRGSAS